ARSHCGLGVLLEKSKQLAEAEDSLRRAAELHEQLVADDPEDPRHRNSLAIALNDLGVILRERRQPAAAAAVYRRAIEIGKQLTAEFPDRPGHQCYLGATYGNLGNIVRDQGEVAAALTWYDKAIEALDPIQAQRRAGSARFFLRNVHWDRANALGQLGRHAEAVKGWQRALELDDGRDGKRLQLFQRGAREGERLQAIS